MARSCQIFRDCDRDHSPRISPVGIPVYAAMNESSRQSYWLASGRWPILRTSIRSRRGPHADCQRRIAAHANRIEKTRRRLWPRYRARCQRAARLVRRQVRLRWQHRPMCAGRRICYYNPRRLNYKVREPGWYPGYQVYAGCDRLRLEIYFCRPSIAGEVDRFQITAQLPQCRRSPLRSNADVPCAVKTTSSSTSIVSSGASSSTSATAIPRVRGHAVAYRSLFEIPGAGH